MMKKIIALFIFVNLIGCKESQHSPQKKRSEIEEVGLDERNSPVINEDKNTIKTRFSSPKNFVWVKSEAGSFGNFIENFELKNYNAPILKYDGTEIVTQNLHEAVFNIDTGTKDLQQCADAIIRLRAEYLWKNKRQNEIQFHFTSGDLVMWNNYKRGNRAFVNGNSVSFRKTENHDDSYENFRKYLDLIFNYAGTISLTKETKPVLKTSDLKTGDILIRPGSPGHVVFIAGVSENKEGKKLFLLAQGFTPAQSIHVMKNPFNPNISPWYELNVDDVETKTSRYLFRPTDFRRF